MYKHLFKNYSKYFHNLWIILLVSSNFKDKIVNIVKKNLGWGEFEKKIKIRMPFYSKGRYSFPLIQI